MEIIGLILTLIFLIAPFSLLFHELGHVIGAKIKSATTILLTIGVGKRIGSFTIQNIHVDIRRFFVINSFTSTIRDQPFTNKEKIFISFMGPFFSGILAFVFFVVNYAFLPSQYFYVAFLFNVWLVLINIIPIKLGQKQSDGFIIARIIFQKLRK